ncbi:MAG TPA: hypothetical protein PK513_02655 [Alphaproteobacteria bacterium]|nr:hypothetical protein [Alphaproteobacteria bacterium]USO05439.1 MAG: hypothetical protein H6859_09905 [Rhodospirillales bacterium]HOO81386.1 hypothetical protein [Alphaproteobacteria bacterium]
MSGAVAFNNLSFDKEQEDENYKIREMEVPESYIPLIDALQKQITNQHKNWTGENEKPKAVSWIGKVFFEPYECFRESFLR